MGLYSIGLNAMLTARARINIAGENIANSNTPGYHAKRAEIHALEGPLVNGMRIGLGSTVQNIQRLRDPLVENMLLSAVQVGERLAQEAETLGNLQTLFNEPTGSGLDAWLGDFFNSVTALAGDPDDLVLRDQVVHKAQAVCDGLNRLSDQVQTLTQHAQSSVLDSVDRINSLTEQIATLNGQIRSSEASGVSASNLMDSRDRLIGELAELTDLTVHEDRYGVVNVGVSGTLIVNGVTNMELAASFGPDGIEINRAGDIGNTVKVSEGRLGALVGLVDDVLPTQRSNLDELANAFRASVNAIHTTGLGLGGRFESLSGLNSFTTNDVAFHQMGYGTAAGMAEVLRINVEDASSGELTQHTLTLDTTMGAADFVAAVRDAINDSVPGLTATVNAGRLELSADSGYRFGFATPYDPNPAQAGDITAADPTRPTVLNAYTGQDELTYEFDFVSGGQVGMDDIDIQVTVKDVHGATLRTLNRRLGPDYTAGSAIDMENGLKFALSTGGVNAGDSFCVTAHATMDSASVLDALGLNTLITGQGAAGIGVAERIARDSSTLAMAISAAPGDNHKAQELLALERTAVVEGGMSLHQAYRAMVSDVATTLNAKTMQHQSQQLLTSSLENRRDAVSGVNTDEEAITIMQSQRLYQAAARYIQAVDQMINELFQTL